MNNNQPPSDKLIFILGGSGQVGALLGQTFTQRGYRICMVDLVKPDAETLHQFHELDILNPPKNMDHLFKHAAAVVFALPERVAIDALPWVLKSVTTETILVPTCSVQEPFYNAITEFAHDQTVVGVNPMFSPKLSAQGRTVLICMANTQAPPSFIEDCLTHAKMLTKRMTPEQHDSLMALCQTLPHAAILAFGLALTKTPLDLKTLVEIAPPPMRAMMALLGRILTNPAQVYWDIQAENKFGGQQQTNLTKEALNLIQMIQSSDYLKFQQSLDNMVTALGSQLEKSAQDCQQMFSSLNQPSAPNL